MALPLPDRPSIAVLPFLNLSREPQQEYFAEGITDDLITDLSKVSGLFVIARNSTFVYQNRPVTPKQVSRELGVRYVLEGSVQRAGDQLRINVQLVDAISGGHEWADRFDGSLTDVFALQDRVTRSIADALAVRLTEADQISLNRDETNVPAAYDAFLRGWVHFRRNTPDDFASAIRYFEEATKLDPAYGRAHAALALAYILVYDAQWTEVQGISDMEARQRATRYLKDAQKQPTAFSHQVAAVIFLTQLQPNEALAELKEAIALDSGDAFSYAYMGAALTASGRPAEAISHIRTAIRLDPHLPAHVRLLSWLGSLRHGQFRGGGRFLRKRGRAQPRIWVRICWSGGGLWSTWPQTGRRGGHRALRRPQCAARGCAPDHWYGTDAAASPGTPISSGCGRDCDWPECRSYYRLASSPRRTE